MFGYDFIILFLMGLSETIISIITGITLLEGSLINYFNKNLIKKATIILSTSVLSLVITLIARYFTESLYTFRVIFMIGIQFLVYKLFFGYNKRQSLFVSYITYLFLLIIETSIFTIEFALPDITFNTITSVLLVRSSQLLILFVIHRLKYNFKGNKCLTCDMNQLNLSNKKSIVVVMILCSIGVIVNSNYLSVLGNTVFTTHVTLINYTLLTFFIQSLLITFAILYFLDIIINYDKYKPLINSVPNKLMDTISNQSNKYLDILSMEVNLDSYEKLTKYLSRLKSTYSNIATLTSVELKYIEYNYSNILFITSTIIEESIRIQDTVSFEIELDVDENNQIITSISIIGCNSDFYTKLNQQESINLLLFEWKKSGNCFLFYIDTNKVTFNLNSYIKEVVS